ncbi:MAG TPA: 50S ribosomal protein L17 [Candidatus Ratteibacteria bacterium]|jgi:large subunit ribosomal protein L17|uniref:50S ribosomal protein L17 n=1 Tax=candidate division TA06 bacterium ADurb.Bin131 TaxID=1852827 RepID=A0A1V6C4G7_UNCT6|nr:MAG: 50S ribosomal protein L17 [candidate division TA06 bacterium ADurb.Bin131]HOC02291.1 50S ribosomal protein L17 [bacterium]HRS06164.1 50S ribosomal protein L17 [Candidatus Ratteibacteria bacterium]HON04851.1 50S ribosomal protein L17 [bacterium]HPC29430.1 50S ribosomal protein L17 [bacterium]
MRHKKDIRKFSRNKSHRKSLLRNMAISFIQNKRIITTEAKAKQLKRVVEKLITTGKTKDLASIRKINAYLNHPETTAMVIELGQKFKERNGGYIKIIKIGCRSGDASKMAVIQMVE